MKYGASSVKEAIVRSSLYIADDPKGSVKVIVY